MAITPIEGISLNTSSGFGVSDHGARQVGRSEAVSGVVGKVLVDGQRPTPAAPIDSDTVKDVVEQLNQRLRSSTATEELEFTVDKETETQLVRLVDSKTKQVLRQIPSEELLAIRKSIDQFKGLFLKEEA